MVPLSEKRHRLYSHETSEIIEGLRLRLSQLLDIREDRERAEIGFRVLYRLLGRDVGRPKYPEFTWGLLRNYLEAYVPLIDEA